MSPGDPPPPVPATSPDRLADTLAASPELWAHLVDHQPDHRVHHRLATGPGWEAYLITWPSGHGVELHDHGGSAGAVAVVEGHLVELVAARPGQATPPGPGTPGSGAGPRPLVRVALPSGSTRRVPARRVHDVVNAGAAPATSIHVYSPPLTTMTFYDDALRPVRTERVFPVPPLLDAAAVEAALTGRPVPS